MNVDKGLAEDLIILMNQLSITDNELEVETKLLELKARHGCSIEVINIDGLTHICVSHDDMENVTMH